MKLFNTDNIETVQISNIFCSELSSIQSSKRALTRNSAKLTNQRVSYAFTFSPFSIHVRHILPTSKFQHSYSCILLILYISEQHVWELWVWIQLTGLTIPLRLTPMKNPITLISPVQSLGYIFVASDSLCVALQISEQFSLKARTPKHWMPSSNRISTQNDHSRSFKVIRFGVNEEPLRGYIA